MLSGLFSSGHLLHAHERNTVLGLRIDADDLPLGAGREEDLAVRVVEEVSSVEMSAITGIGTAQPNGILTGATLGVTGPTGTATSLGSQTTVGQGADLLIDLQGSLAGPYARSASAAWLMRQSTLQIVKKLRDSTGRYIFSADVVPGSGSAGTILGRPVFTDEAMPAAAANAKSIIYGDLSKYWVRQVGMIRSSAPMSSPSTGIW